MSHERRKGCLAGAKLLPSSDPQNPKHPKKMWQEDKEEFCKLQAQLLPHIHTAQLSIVKTTCSLFTHQPNHTVQGATEATEGRQRDSWEHFLKNGKHLFM